MPLPVRAPCRLFVYLAREAPVGVVLRRGLSAWTRLSVWHTDADTFEHGQWLAGRVYERRGDVSADGRLFVYFARKSGRGRPEQRADTLIAISRPPWLTALALWWVGGTYCAGGLFLDQSNSLAQGHQSVYVGGMAPPDQGTMPPWLTQATTVPRPDQTPNWTDRTVWHNRLWRDGWQPVGGEQGTASVYEERWQRRHPTEPLTLVMRQTHTGFATHPYGGPYVMDYALRREPSDELTDLGPATWADWDQRGRLAMARRGRLLVAEPGTEPGGALRELADFNDQVPDPATSPAWARAWPA